MSLLPVFLTKLSKASWESGIRLPKADPAQSKTKRMMLDLNISRLNRIKKKDDGEN
eukprot:CAMPEP_0201493208 /NCGR_PEP_ID=MMETSP0151_2-20130828/36281_1 /ASSEMBLY_ACC=CAM_ASM_000257 /TAXON_ID=200890 /ORGANISM="Paramoeba atlantica, Strain 621/1 / CCAP 1560/9" /LENGTH=55 /DNA_ID=CAMNT_0047880417 /DNA_START=524 /DNA_END=688 /DNA_ORIENTATION=+